MNDIHHQIYNSILKHAGSMDLLDVFSDKKKRLATLVDSLDINKKKVLCKLLDDAYELKELASFLGFEPSKMSWAPDYWRIATSEFECEFMITFVGKRSYIEKDNND
jgi:hypothetical protein